MPITSQAQKRNLRKEYLKVRKMYLGGRYSNSMIGFRFGRNKGWVDKIVAGKGFPLLDKMNLSSLTTLTEWHKKMKKS